MDTIKSKSDIEVIFKTGRWYNHANLRILVKERLLERDCSGRVAFIAGKKTGNAVSRNRAKRLLRECARLEQLPYDGYDIILIATNKTKECALYDLSEALSTLLLRADLKS